MLQTDCIEWGRSRTRDGYGLAWNGRSMVAAHRLLWEEQRGPIREGLELDHLCRNRSCVNLDHLEPITHRENVLRGDTIPARYAARTHCAFGHAFDEANTLIRGDGRRVCRQCKRELDQRYSQSEQGKARHREAARRYRERKGVV